jgi:hypothetical protein
MDRRKKILVNNYETLTNDCLLHATKVHGAFVLPKVRIADALDINYSGLDYQEYSYALKAHFDFIVTEEDYTTAFAVEFDEHYHNVDSSAALKDARKNTICSKLGLPLLRITSEYLHEVGRFPSLIGWIAEIYFLREAFYAAQQEGRIPMDEPWLWFSVIGYDPFISSRASIEEANLVPEIVRASDHKRHIEYAIAIINVDDNQYLIGSSQCFSGQFYAISSFALCEELAILAVSEKLVQFQRKQLNPLNPDQVQYHKARMQSLKS